MDDIRIVDAELEELSSFPVKTTCTNDVEDDPCPGDFCNNDN
jgi:hypothetical protein